jgi:2,3-bisphosphoglycerate-dependent phosphoglycerate mutase
MVNLILVRHSEPAWDPEIPPSRWLLTERGRHRSKLLGEYLGTRKIGQIFASSELKAIETAEIAAGFAGISLVNTDHDLREHDRDETRVVLTSSERRSLIIECLRRPETLIHGSVTVGTARRRFGKAVFRLMENATDQTVAIVAHGTVISSYVGELIGIDPVPIWDSMGLPGFVEIDWSNPTEILDKQQFD